MNADKLNRAIELWKMKGDVLETISKHKATKEFTKILIEGENGNENSRKFEITDSQLIVELRSYITQYLENQIKAINKEIELL